MRRAFRSLLILPVLFAFLSTPCTADTGFDNDIRAIGNYNGDLIVGGDFNQAAGFSSIKVAGFNSGGWYAMTGFPNGNPVYWLHQHDSLIYAGQALTQLCSWNGSSWTGHLPWLGGPFGNISALETYNNELYVGGGFTGDPSLPSFIAIWTGSGWDSVGTGVTGAIWALHAHGGDLIASGGFTEGIAKWDGANWSLLASGISGGGILALESYNAELIAAGGFTSLDGTSFNHIARWNGSTWQSVGTGFDGTVEALYVHDGKLIAGGRFANAGGSPIPNIASWDGASWSPIGAGLDDDVYALGEYNGYLVAGGRFTTAGGHVALWDGSIWRPVSDFATAISDDESTTRPEGFSLGQNYPNPFNPSTTIEFTLSAPARVELDVFNIAGQRVRALAGDRFPAGEHSIVWDGRSDGGSALASGVYFYRLRTDDFVETRKMVLLK